MLENEWSHNAIIFDESISGLNEILSDALLLLKWKVFALKLFNNEHHFAEAGFSLVVGNQFSLKFGYEFEDVSFEVVFDSFQRHNLFHLQRYYYIFTQISQIVMDYSQIEKIIQTG